MIRLQAWPTRNANRPMVFFWMPVMRSTARMLAPSQSIEIAATFFSVLSMFAISFI